MPQRYQNISISSESVQSPVHLLAEVPWARVPDRTGQTDRTSQTSRIGENPGGVLWCTNPSFPLKGSVSEPEGEAWVEVGPYLSYPEGVAYNQLLGMS